MEKDKVNSQELIDDAVGQNEDIYDALNSPDSHIFSLQRFADVTLRQQGGSATTLLSSDSLTGVLSAYTLGRSSDQSITNSVFTDASTTLTLNGASFFIAPLISSDTTGGLSELSSSQALWNDTYKIKAVQVSASETRIAFEGDKIPVQYSVGNGNAWNYYVGIAVSDTSGIWLDPQQTDSILYASRYTATSYKYPEASTLTSIYKAMIYDSNIRQGSRTALVASTTGMAYTLDFYDVTLGTHTGITNQNLDNLVTGTYVYQLSTT